MASVQQKRPLASVLAWSPSSPCARSATRPIMGSMPIDRYGDRAGQPRRLRHSSKEHRSGSLVESQVKVQRIVAVDHSGLAAVGQQCAYGSSVVWSKGVEAAWPSSRLGVVSVKHREGSCPRHHQPSRRAQVEQGMHGVQEGGPGPTGHLVLDDHRVIAADASAQPPYAGHVDGSCRAVGRPGPGPRVAMVRLPTDGRKAFLGAAGVHEIGTGSHAPSSSRRLLVGIGPQPFAMFSSERSPAATVTRVGGDT